MLNCKTPPISCLALGLLAALSGPCAAQYKVVGPDGRVTYTDQRPQEGKAQALALPGSGTPSVANLPEALKAPVQRYPVTLYTTKGCGPCDNGRDLLRQRGIPFTEKTIETEFDNAALSKLSGDRSLPLLTIGSQQLKGFHSVDWASYLDAAGYPKTSALPANYRQPPAQALAPQPAQQALVRGQKERSTELARPRAPTVAPADPNAPGIRF